MQRLATQVDTQGSYVRNFKEAILPLIGSLQTKVQDQEQVLNELRVLMQQQQQQLQQQQVTTRILKVQTPLATPCMQGVQRGCARGSGNVATLKRCSASGGGGAATLQRCNARGGNPLDTACMHLRRH